MDVRIINLWQENETLKRALKDYDPQANLRASDKAQAANRKFQLLKPRLRSLMVQVDVMLAKLDELGRSNVVTKVDLQQLRELRDWMKEARAEGLKMKADADA